MLVDDRPLRRRIMREVLLAVGVSSTDISEADNVAAVIVGAGPEPDVVVLERQRLMSADLADISSLRGQFPDLRIEIASFRTDDETKRLEVEAGADCHLDKPVRTADVRAMLDRAQSRIPESEPSFASASPASGPWPAPEA
jgi:DNA-binding NarL/FixJ family response regulator